jgi:AcrR family transcriptional regulator
MIGIVKESMRERLIDAATELFYDDGIRAVSVDRIVERASTTKVTFYRHFPTKDDLVLAHLARRAEQERAGISGAIEAASGSPEASFAAIGRNLGIIACAPGFRGCPFINAAAEYPDPSSVVRRAVAEHRTWCRDAFTELVRPVVGDDAAEDRGRDLMLIRDGAMVAGALDDAEALAASFVRSATALLAGDRAGV